MSDIDDPKFKAALTRGWHVPDPSDAAKARLLCAAEFIHSAKTKQKISRWIIASSAIAATFFAAIVVLPTAQKTPTTSIQSSTPLTDEEMLNYVFATYSLEETL